MYDTIPSDDGSNKCCNAAQSGQCVSGWRAGLGGEGATKKKRMVQAEDGDVGHEGEM